MSFNYDEEQKKILGTSRRDLLKLFTAGAVITPLAGGASAKLIETPKVEIIKPETGIVAPLCPDDVANVDITFRMKDGSARRFQADEITLPDRSNQIGLRNWKPPERKYISSGQVQVLLLEERASSPTYYECLASFDMKGKFRNRNAVVELP